jgi:hypothetical protein
LAEVPLIGAELLFKDSEPALRAPPRYAASSLMPSPTFKYSSVGDAPVFLDATYVVL